MSAGKIMSKTKNQLITFSLLPMGSWLNYYQKWTFKMRKMSTFYNFVASFMCDQQSILFSTLVSKFKFRFNACHLQQRFGFNNFWRLEILNLIRIVNKSIILSDSIRICSSLTKYFLGVALEFLYSQTPAMNSNWS